MAPYVYATIVFSIHLHLKVPYSINCLVNFHLEDHFLKVCVGVLKMRLFYPAQQESLLTSLSKLCAASFNPSTAVK